MINAVSEYLKSRYGNANNDDRQDYAHYGLVRSTKRTV